MLFQLGTWKKLILFEKLLILYDEGSVRFCACKLILCCNCFPSYLSQKQSHWKSLSFLSVASWKLQIKWTLISNTIFSVLSSWSNFCLLSFTDWIVLLLYRWMVKKIRGTAVCLASLKLYSSGSYLQSSGLDPNIRSASDYSKMM